MAPIPTMMCCKRAQKVLQQYLPAPAAHPVKASAEQTENPQFLVCQWAGEMRYAVVGTMARAPSWYDLRTHNHAWSGGSCASFSQCLFGLQGVVAL